MVDFDFFLRQKYAQLQQQADATTQNAKTNSVVGQAAARLDNTRSALLPAESKAGIAKTFAETGLIGEQAKVVAPTAAANIENTQASTGLIRQQTVTEDRLNNPIGQNFGSGIGEFVRLVTGGGGSMPAGGQQFRTSNIVPAFPNRRAAAGGNPGRMSVEELDAQQPPWRY